MARQFFRRRVGVLLFLVLAACKTTSAENPGDARLAGATPGDAPVCTGELLRLCRYAGSYELGAAIDLAVDDVQGKASLGLPAAASGNGSRVACVEVAYPGKEPEVERQQAERGSYLCLFDTQYSMNMALNRISTFVEDFVTVDSEPGYSDAGWAARQQSESTKGHNLESPDLVRYLSETKAYVDQRAGSAEPGIRLENEFLQGFIGPMLDPQRGKPSSIVLGVYLPPVSDAEDPRVVLRAYLGHEIFHALYFHSEKMRHIVKSYIDAQPQAAQALMRRRLSQKGYAVTNGDGTPPSPKQVYMFYNEAAAYLLESGACVDGAFMSYEDDAADEPNLIIANHAPLVVEHAGRLRKRLLEARVITTDWARIWSPELSGCQR